MGLLSAIDLDITFATINVPLFLDGGFSFVIDHVVVGRDAHFKRMFNGVELHIVGVHEGRDREARTWSSGRYLRLRPGLNAEHKTGDVELWRLLDSLWGVINNKNVCFTNGMATVQFAAQRYMIVSIRAPWFSYDVAVSHSTLVEESWRN